MSYTATSSCRPQVVSSATVRTGKSSPVALSIQVCTLSMFCCLILITACGFGNWAVCNVGRGWIRYGLLTLSADFSGHSATIAPDGVGQVPPAELLIAHYLGRARSYVSSVKQHQDVVNLRRRQVEEAPTTTWRDSPLCFFRILFRRHLCSAPTQSHLAESACAARPNASWLQQLQDCLIEGAEPSPYPFQLPMSRQTGEANDC